MNRFRNSLPPLTSLLPFEAAARLGSVTKASNELGLTQAAISRQIRVLEENLGTPLFDRRNRAIYLTDDGRALLQVVSEALETVSSCATRLRSPRKNVEVVLFAQLCEGLYWVMPRLSKFYQNYPSVEVRVSTSTRPLTETTEYFDVALQTSSRRSGECKLAFTAPDEVFPVCGPQYMDEHQCPMSLDDLQNHHLLHHKVYPQDWIEWDEWLEQLNHKVRVKNMGTVYDSYPMMIQAAIEGHGIALGWKQTTQRLLQSGVLVRPFVESLKLSDGLSVYLHPQCVLRPDVEALLDWLKTELINPE